MPPPWPIRRHERNGSAWPEMRSKSPSRPYELLLHCRQRLRTLHHLHLDDTAYLACLFGALGYGANVIPRYHGIWRYFTVYNLHDDWRLIEHSVALGECSHEHSHLSKLQNDFQSLADTTPASCGTTGACLHACPSLTCFIVLCMVRITPGDTPVGAR